MRYMWGIGLMCICIFFMSAAAWAQPAKGETVPVFKASDIHDQIVDIEAILKENPDITVLFFFSVKNDADLADKLRRVEGRYGRVLAVELQHPVEDLRRFAEIHDIPYHLFEDGPEITAENRFGPFSTLPVTFFVACDRTILNVLLGGGEQKERVIIRIAEHYLKHDPEKSRQAADDAVEAAEDETEAMVVRAFADVELGELDEAEQVFQHLDMEEGLAKVALEKGDTTTAIKLASQSDSSYAHVVRGEALLVEGNTEQAKIAFDTAVEKPASEWQLSDAYHGRGRVAHEAGDLDSALENYQQSVELDVFNRTALSNQSAAYRENGDLEDAVQILEMAQGRGINDSYINMMLQQIRQDIVSLHDMQRQEMIRQQIAELGARFRQMKEEGQHIPLDSWTSRPMVMALLPGEIQSGVFFERAGMDTVLRREITARLGAQKGIHMVDRDMLDMLLRELELSSSDLVNPDTQLQLGRIFAARYLGFLDFTRMGKDLSLYIRFVDTETSIIGSMARAAISPSGDIDTVITSIVDNVVHEIVDDKPLQGLISEVVDNRVEINLGSIHGVHIGQEFEILMEGPPREVAGITRPGRLRSVGKLVVDNVVDDWTSDCHIVDGTLDRNAVLKKEMKIRAQTK